VRAVKNEEGSLGVGKGGGKVLHIKNAAQLDKMRESCELSSAALTAVAEVVSEGSTTYDIDRAIRRFLKSAGAKPSFLGLYNFPAAACISVNEELIHGLPSKRVLRTGDIVSIDVGAFYNGFNGDNAYTYVVGGKKAASPEVLRLLKVTEESLYLGIAQARAGNRIGDIGHAIQSHCESSGYYVVKEFIGHGVGADLHEDPEVPNFGKPGKGRRIVPGMTLAIEPMINSTTDKVKILPNKWTVIEKNKRPCAHFEHTIAATDGEPVILTSWHKTLESYGSMCV